MLVIERQDASGVLELPGRLDGMRVVVAQNAIAIRFVQRQRVPDAMRNLVGYLDAPRLQLDPVAVSLFKNRPVQIKRGVNGGIALRV